MTDSNASLPNIQKIGTSGKEPHIILASMNVPDTIPNPGDLSRVFNPREHIEYQKIRSQKSKASHFYGRLTAKTATAKFLNENDLTSIAIQNGIFQQPFVQYKALEVPGLSISHSHARAVALVFSPGYPMGIDIEKINPARSDAIRSQLTQNEKALLKTHNNTLQLLFQIWTIKEALSKALLCGMFISFNLLEIHEPKFLEDFVQVNFENFPQYTAKAWTHDDYALALVYPHECEISLKPN